MRNRDFEFRAQQSLRRGRSQAHDQRWPHRFNFRLEPRAAGKNLPRGRLLVNAKLAARLPFKVLYRVGDINSLAVDPGYFEALIEKLSRRSDKGMAFPVLTIAGLFADHQHPRPRAFMIRNSALHLSEHSLDRVSIEFAPAAALHCLAQHR